MKLIQLVSLLALAYFLSACQSQGSAPEGHYAVKTQKKETSAPKEFNLEGKVTLSIPLVFAPKPLKYGKMGVFKGDKKVSEFETDSYGRYEVKLTLRPGEYTIRPISKKYVGIKTITVDGGDMTNIQVNLNEAEK